MSASTAVAVVLNVRPHAEPECPESGPLVDRFGRVHRKLRISVTDRCNFRCTYCMPDGPPDFEARHNILSFGEVVRIASVARALGVTSVRLTGGEPLLRRGLPDLVKELSSLDFADIALTTNGSLLRDSSAHLARAGLHRITVSCDSLRPERFRAIRRRGDLDIVLASMDAAEVAGFPPVKVNVVLQRSVNDDEILPFADFARRTGRQVRFIEFMPLDALHGWARYSVVPGAEVVRVIASRWPIQAVTSDPAHPAPATNYRFADGAGGFGLVNSVTEPFCSSCDRLRLTADGMVRNCLFSDQEFSLRDLLRSGAEDSEIELLLRRAVWGKAPGHGREIGDLRHPRRAMFRIGG